MAQYPPPPPGGQPARGQRPGTITAVGVLLIVRGGLSILIGLISLGLSSVNGFFTLVGILFLPVGAVEIYAGVQVLNLREIGRQLGMILAVISLVLGLIFLVKFATGIIGLLLDGFIIYTLYSNKQYFTA
jgi:uncharacterized membrane protein HdeD (DUF308 family)